jgi:hypothetical protein
MIDGTRNSFALTGISILLVCIAGCARSVDVTAVFPEPLVEPYPLVVGIRYAEDLPDFTHIEDPLLEPEWEIRLGAANVLMFNTLFAGMFSEIIELAHDSEQPVDPTIDLIIEPALKELEFSSPRQSGTDQYVVWLRYNLKLLLPNGEVIGDWRITGYGQEDQGTMDFGSENALRDAAITALRDTAANIIIDFPNAPGISTIIKPATHNDEQDEQG